jgi:uncharacterized membrane protein YesL
MADSIRLFVGALRLWWRELLFLLVLNVLWLVGQLTVVLGPPMTVSVYVVARKVMEGDLVDFKDVIGALRQHLAASWAWGALQVIVYGVLGFNLFFYARAEGQLVLILRYAWTLLLLAWFTLNLYYWPLYLVQEDRRVATTLSNAGKMILLNPGFTLVYSLLALVLIAVSIFSGLLLGAVMMAWLALWGNLVVANRLDARRPRTGNHERRA